nr:hypothetical protein [Tanacetum cinerariifolium]
MKSSTTNVETPIIKEVFHEVFESFQGESSSSSLNDDVQQSPEEVIPPQTNTQSIPINMVPNGDEASTSHNVFNERLKDAYFDASTSFHDPSNVHTFYQPYPHKKKWTKDHPLHKIIGDPKSSKFKEDLFTYCVENGILQDSSEPSNDNTNIVNALQEPFVVNQDPGENSSQSPPQINHYCCYGCGDPLEDIFCHQCTCELCGNGAHYGYNCSPKVPIVPNPEPFNNQTINELPQTFLSFDLTFYSKNGNSFTYDSTSNLVHILLTFSTHLRNFLFILVNFVRTTLEENKQIKEEQAAKTRYWKILACYYDDDDDDEDYSIAITPSLSTEEPDNSL